MAVAYEADDIGSMATTVVDGADGTVVRHYPRMEALASSNGAWIGEHQLIMVPSAEYGGPPIMPLMVADVPGGGMRRYDARPSGWAGAYYAVIDGRVIQDIRGKGVFSTELDGSDPQLFLSTPPDPPISVFEVAPSAAR